MDLLRKILAEATFSFFPALPDVTEDVNELLSFFEKRKSSAASSPPQVLLTWDRILLTMLVGNACLNHLRSTLMKI